MKIVLSFLLLFISFFAYAEDIENIELVSIYDGDTFKINIKNSNYEVFGKNIGVRIYGIDTPEIKSESQREKQLAIKAKILTTQLLNSGKIILKDVKRDKYFRILATVIVVDDNGNIIDVGKTLIDNGLAKLYFGNTKEKF